MPFTRTKSEPLNARCNVRLTASEKAELCEAAALANMSLSEYMRRRALGVTVIARTDVLVMNELRRLGGLLKKVHVDSDGAYSHTTAVALRNLSSYMETIARDR